MKLKQVLLALGGLATLFTAYNYKEAGMILGIITAQLDPLQPSSKLPEEKNCGSSDPLVNHMMVFANKNCEVDEQSILDACIHKWGLEKDKASILAASTMAIAWKQNVKGVSMVNGKIVGKFKPIDARDRLTHPVDTGIFTKLGGGMDEDRFYALQKYALVDGNGVLLLSESRIDAYKRDWYKQDHRWDSASWFDNIIGEIGTKGEFEFLFKRGASRWAYNPITKQTEAFITVKDLKEFYLDSRILVKKIQNGKLPAAEPSKKLIKQALRLQKTCPPRLSFFDKMINNAVCYAQEVTKKCPGYFRK